MRSASGLRLAFPGIVGIILAPVGVYFGTILDHKWSLESKMVQKSIHKLPEWIPNRLMGSKQGPQGAKGRPREPKGSPRESKTGPKRVEGSPEGAQREPKGGPREPQETQKGGQESQNTAKGTPKRAKRGPKRMQNETKHDLFRICLFSANPTFYWSKTNDSEGRGLDFRSQNR